MPTRSSRTWRRLKLLLTLLAVSAFLFLMPARFTAPARLVFTEAVGPAQTALFQGAGEALAAGGTLTDLIRGEERQRALAGELVRAQNENARLREALRRQEARLQSVQGLDLVELEFRAVRAPLSAYDATPTQRGITVRAGRRDGVEPGLAVTSRGALVGVVQQVGPWQCRVRLITDPDSAVPCRLGSTRAVCVLQGTGGGTCSLDWIDREGFVKRGDVVTTTALEVDRAGGLRLPEGLPAATVTDVSHEHMQPLFYRVEATPRVNLERLEEVEVLVPKAKRF